MPADITPIRISVLLWSLREENRVCVKECVCRKLWRQGSWVKRRHRWQQRGKKRTRHFLVGFLIATKQCRKCWKLITCFKLRGENLFGTNGGWGQSSINIYSKLQRTLNVQTFVRIDYLIHKCNFIQCALNILCMQCDTEDNRVLKTFSCGDMEKCLMETTMIYFH